MTLLQDRKAKKKTRWIKSLLAMGWTTDGVWWFNPRSGIRYNFSTAVNLEELRASSIDL